MTVAENRERGHYVETAACDRWPLERVGHDRVEWHDLEFVDDVVGDRVGVIAAAGDVVEAKSCYATYDGRAGRWWIRRENHEQLVDVDGWYVLVVLERETDEIHRIALTRAETVDRIIDGNWWDCGDGGRSARQFRQLPWTAVFVGNGLWLLLDMDHLPADDRPLKRTYDAIRQRTVLEVLEDDPGTVDRGSG